MPRAVALPIRRWLTLGVVLVLVLVLVPVPVLVPDSLPPKACALCGGSKPGRFTALAAGARARCHRAGPAAPQPGPDKA